MANTLGVGTLSRAPEGLTGDLHHEYQKRTTDFSGDRMIRTVKFAGPAFNGENTVQLNVLSMSVERMLLRFQLGAWSESADPNLTLEPTTTWVTSVILGYQEAVLYQCQEEELITYYYDNPNSNQDFIDQLIAHNDWGYDPAGWAGKARKDTSRCLFLDLAPIADKIMSKIGSLDAYQPKSLYLTVNLKSSYNIVSAENGSPVSITAEIPISALDLVLVGHREDRVAVRRYQEALLNRGIRLALEQPNYSRAVISTSAEKLDYTLSTPSISGDVTYFSILMRDYDAWKSTTPATSRNLKWIPQDILVVPTSTLDIGTSESESELFGRPVPLYVLQSAFKGRSITGSTRFMAQDGLRQIAKVPVPMGMDTSAGQVDGVWSGGFRVQNNLVFRFRFEDGLPPGYATLLQVITYVRRILVIGAYSQSSATE